jgi:hypothetical protein
MAKPRGSRLASYEILALIGVGGMGEVSVDANVFGGVLSADPVVAEQYLRTAEELAVGNAPFYLMGVAVGYRRLGLETDANRALDRYFEWGSKEQIGAADWVRYYLLRGDLDQAYEWLRRAVETIENGEADAGFFALQRFVNPTDPPLLEGRFRPLTDRLRTVAAD